MKLVVVVFYHAYSINSTDLCVLKKFIYGRLYNSFYILVIGSISCHDRLEFIAPGRSLLPQYFNKWYHYDYVWVLCHSCTAFGISCRFSIVVWSGIAHSGPMSGTPASRFFTTSTLTSSGSLANSVSGLLIFPTRAMRFLDDIH